MPPFLAFGAIPARPEFIPENYEPLIDALNRVGKSTYGEEWTGKEWYARQSQQITGEGVLAARRRKKLEQAFVAPGKAGSSISNSSPSSGTVYAYEQAQVAANRTAQLPRIYFESETAESAAADRAVTIWTKVRRWIHLGRVPVKGLLPGGHLVSIPNHVWAASDANRWVATGKASYRSSGHTTVEWVLVQSQSLTEALQSASVPSTLEPAQPLTQKPAAAMNIGGRPRRWDWEGVLIAMTAVVHNEGVPALQADMERRMRAWFMDKTGNAPAPSEIRKRARRLLAELKTAEN
jgi:hypothetical protein